MLYQVIAIGVMLIIFSTLNIVFVSIRQRQRPDFSKRDHAVYSSMTVLIRFLTALTTSVCFVVSVALTPMTVTGALWTALTLFLIIISLLSTVVSINRTEEARQLRNEGIRYLAYLGDMDSWNRFEDQAIISISSALILLSAMTLLTCYKRRNAIERRMICSANEHGLTPRK